jgi:hypothetical protein
VKTVAKKVTIWFGDETRNFIAKTVTPLIKYERDKASQLGVNL